MMLALFLLPLGLATAGIFPESELDKRGLGSAFSRLGSIFKSAGASKRLGSIFKKAHRRHAVVGDDAAKEAAKAVKEFYGKRPFPTGAKMTEVLPNHKVSHDLPIGYRVSQVNHDYSYLPPRKTGPAIQNPEPEWIRNLHGIHKPPQAEAAANKFFK